MIFWLGCFGDGYFAPEAQSTFGAFGPFAVIARGKERKKEKGKRKGGGGRAAGLGRAFGLGALLFS